MKTANVLKAFGFELDAEEMNLYYREAEDDNCDVIRYFEDDDCYNICIVDDDCYDFINEKELLSILTK